MARLEREEMRIPSQEPGFEVFVMRIRAPNPKGAVVMTHGAGSPSSAIWDLRHKDYSLMRNLACAGFDTYALDVRGFGGSTKMPGLKTPPEGKQPLVRAAETMPDVGAVVAFAQRSSNVEAVDIFAWSWGCDVAAMYASRHPKSIRRLVLFAPVYDRRWPSRHIAKGAWRAMPKSELFAFFDAAREEREVLEEIATGMFRFSAENERELRLPNGPYRDIYGVDAPVWSARRIEAHTLVLRGDQDKASTAQSVRHLLRDLSRARSKRETILKGLGHFAFRERGHAALTTAVIAFLSAPEADLSTSTP
ncbi:MAG: alpha/beta fold hydrolase [Deltaproteobacteria bacterium]|nr:alpha/beta fold hydrolase [Deltaproteobacteria bacterium]